MAQAAQGFALDLANALAGEAKFVSHLFQGVGAPVFQAKTQAQNARLARGQCVEHFFHLFAKQLGVGALDGRWRQFIFHKHQRADSRRIRHREVFDRIDIRILFECVQPFQRRFIRHPRHRMLMVYDHGHRLQATLTDLLQVRRQPDRHGWTLIRAERGLQLRHRRYRQ